MYKHWYVAQINQLSNKETAIFLSSLELLENTMAATRLRECALIELERHFDLNLQIYLLPALIKVALSSEADSTLNEKAIWLIREICTKTNNKKAIEFAKCLEKREQLLLLLQSIDSGRTSQKKMLDSDYIELNAYVETIMALGIFRQLSTEEVENLLDQGDNWADLLLSAVEGYFGRYCIVLASDVISYHKILLLPPNNSQIASFSPVIYAQPDLLYSWLSLHVAQMSADECLSVKQPYKSREAASDSSVQNAMTWLFRGRKCAEIENNEYYDAINQLWNYSLWILAIRKAIREDNLSILADKLSNEWTQNNWQKTPWIHRKYAKYDKRYSSDINNPEYPSMKEQAGAMKSALAMPIVSLLILHLKQVIPDFIIDLSLNLNDVYACPGVREFIDNGSFDKRDYSYAVVALLSYAKETSEQIGKGYYNPLVPKLYTQLINQKARSIFLNKDIEIDEQERFLHSGASIMACAYFAYEEASGTIPNTNKVHFWLEDESDSLAAQITKIALNEFCLYLNNNAEYNGSSAYQVLEKAIWLAYERFPGQITDAVKNNLKMRDNGRDLIYTSELRTEKRIHNGETNRPSYVYPFAAELLIENHTAAEWAGASIELPNRNEDSAKRFSQRLMTITRKLIRTINVPEELGNDSYSYLERWTGTIASFYKNEEFSRVHRYMTTELLKELLTTNAFERIN